MKIEIAMFAAARELVQSDKLSVEIADDSTVKDLKQTLIVGHPTLGEIVPRSVISVDLEYAKDDQILTESSEVALIPPVSGG